MYEVAYDEVMALLLTISAAAEIMNFDVKTAFLFGDVDKGIILEQTEGHIDKKKSTRPETAA